MEYCDVTPMREVTEQWEWLLGVYCCGTCTVGGQSSGEGSDGSCCSWVQLWTFQLVLPF